MNDTTGRAKRTQGVHRGSSPHTPRVVSRCISPWAREELNLRPHAYQALLSKVGAWRFVYNATGFQPHAIFAAKAKPSKIRHRNVHSAYTRAVRLLGLAALLMCSACERETSYGRCVGLNGHEQSDRVYAYSARNIIVGIATIGLIVPPVLVVLDGYKCPVGTKVAPVPSIGPRSDGAR